MRVRALIVVASAGLLASCGITGNFRHDPGYAAFGSLQRLESSNDFALSLGPLPLRLAGWVLDEDDADLKSLLAELRAVRVYTFEVALPPERVAREVEKVTADLRAKGWTNVVTVHDRAEVTSVLLRPGERGANRGLTVIVQDPSEVVLVNLIGNVQLHLFADYMAELDVEIPPLEIDPITLQARLLTEE